MTQGITIRKGAILLQRRGPLNFAKQDFWKRNNGWFDPPERKGMWAFPWPLDEPYLNWHQVERRMSKKALESHDEYEKWLKNNLRNVVPLKKFYWDGLLYCHFDTGDMSDDGWSLLTPKEFQKEFHKIRGIHQHFDRNEDGEVVGRGPSTSADFFEVFLSPKHGKVVGRV